MRIADTRLRWGLVAVLAIPYLWMLASNGIIGPDEARYAAIGKQMALSGDWVTPVLWGSPWFEKPPLLYWLIAVFSKLGLPADLAVRLPVAFVGIALVAAMPTLEAMLVLGTSLGWLALSQVAVTDLPMSACFMGWLLLMARGRFGLAGVSLGLAVLAKGLVPLALALPAVWFYRREWRHWVGATCVALPWYLACYVQNGQVFVDEFLWKHHVGRFLSPELQHGQSWWFYLPVLAGFFLPWTPVLSRFRGDRENRIYLWTAAWGLVFFSVATNKLPAYILPLVPPMAVLAGGYLKRWNYVFAAGLLASLPLMGPWVPVAIDQGLSKVDFSSTAWGYLATGAAATAIAWRWPRAGVLAAFVFSIVALKWSVYPDMAGTVSARGRALTCIEGGASRGFRYSAYYYAGRVLPDCGDEAPR